MGKKAKKGKSKKDDAPVEQPSEFDNMDVTQLEESVRLLCCSLQRFVYTCFDLKLLVCVRSGSWNVS